MRLVNLTPHTINVVNGPTVPPSGDLARVSQTDKQIGEITVDGETVTVVQSTFGEITGLPTPAEGVGYIVSALVAQAARAAGRTTEELFLSSGPVRDEEGRIVGCKQLAQL